MNTELLHQAGQLALHGITTVALFLLTLVAIVNLLPKILNRFASLANTAQNAKNVSATKVQKSKSTVPDAATLAAARAATLHHHQRLHK